MDDRQIQGATEAVAVVDTPSIVDASSSDLGQFLHDSEDPGKFVHIFLNFTDVSLCGTTRRGGHRDHSPVFGLDDPAPTACSCGIPVCPYCRLLRERPR